MSSTAQLLKRYGHLSEIGLANLSTARAVEAAAEIDAAVLLGRACGHPDHADEEIASATDVQLAISLSMEESECESLRLTHRRMLEAAGQGSFPPGCHLDLYPHADRHCVTYWIKRSSFNNNWLRIATADEVSHIFRAGVWPWSEQEMLDRFVSKPILDSALVIVEEAYRRIGVKLLQVTDQDKANIVLLSRPISGSTIGIGWFNSATCRDTVESHYDSSWQPALYSVCLLLAHEMGHNNNLQHEFSNQAKHRGVMSYSWPNNFYGFLTGEEGILPRDPSWSPLTKFYGGEPIPLDEPPKPPVPPTGPAPRLSDITVTYGTKKYVYRPVLVGDDGFPPIGV